MIYTNADIQKQSLIIDNRGKTGIYRWTNKKNGKTYIGSSANLSRRFAEYYCYTLIANKKRKRAINLALLKHGYSNFQLEILEYCKKSELIKREQYYLDLLQPEYNILKIAGSRLGSKHSVETKKKMSVSRLGEGNTFFGKFHSNETKAKLREAQKDNSQTLEVLDRALLRFYFT